MGSLVQTGGINSSSFNLGQNQGDVGSYTLSGSGLITATTEWIGNGGSGGFSQSGGTNSSYETVELGHSYTSNGTYNLSGGLLNSRIESVGNEDNGTFTQNGGTNSASEINLGIATGGVGSYNLSGGLLSAGIEEQIGGDGSGTFTQSGGTNSISGSLNLAPISGFPGTYNLHGGLLTLTGLTQGSGTAAFNFSGGTLQAGRLFQQRADAACGHEHVRHQQQFDDPFRSPLRQRWVDQGRLRQPCATGGEYLYRHNDDQRRHAPAG